MKNRWFGIVGAAIAITFVTMAILYTGNSVIGVTTESFSEAQRSAFTFDMGVEASEVIILGKVQKIETKLVDLTDRQELVKEGDQVYQRSPFTFVTIDVEEYFKDVTGQYSDSFTFKEFGEGVGSRDGEKVLFTIDGQTTGYQIGERAVFFISDSMYGLMSDSVALKFYINDDNTIHTLYYNLTGIEKPIDLDKARERIPYVLERQSTVEDYLNTPQAETIIENTSQDLGEVSISLVDNKLVRAIAKSELKSQYDDGQDLVIDSEKIKTRITNAWMQSKERDSRLIESGIAIISSSSTQTQEIAKPDQ